MTKRFRGSQTNAAIQAALAIAQGQAQARVPEPDRSEEPEQDESNTADSIVINTRDARGEPITVTISPVPVVPNPFPRHILKDARPSLTRGRNLNDPRVQAELFSLWLIAPHICCERDFSTEHEQDILQ